MLLKNYERGGSLFFLFISLVFFIESLRLGIGTLKKPSMGFLAFGVSGLLGILSLILFLQTFFKKEGAKTKPFADATHQERVPIVIILILIYAILMPVAGYLISTFLFMAFLFWIVGRKKVWLTLILSFLTTLITYYSFSVWLQCHFPSGLFKL